MEELDKLVKITSELSRDRIQIVRTQGGLIAQEVVQQVVPESESLDYQKLVSVLTKAIQELSSQVAALEQSLSSAVANISSLQAQVTALQGNSP